MKKSVACPRCEIAMIFKAVSQNGNSVVAQMKCEKCGTETQLQLACFSPITEKFSFNPSLKYSLSLYLKERKFELQPDNPEIIIGEGI